MQSMSVMVAPVTSLVSRATLSENRRFEWWANLTIGLPASSSSIASSRSSSSRSRRSSYASLSAFVEWLYDEPVSSGVSVRRPPSVARMSGPLTTAAYWVSPSPANHSLAARSLAEPLAPPTRLTYRSPSSMVAAFLF